MRMAMKYIKSSHIWMLGFGVLRQGRACLRDFGIDNLRHGVASAGIRHLIKRGNYLAGICLLAIPR